MKTLLFFLVLFTTTAWTQTPVPDFSLVNAADGTTISLEGYAAGNPVVVLFTTNDCAYDNYYTSRVKTLIDRYKGKVKFLLINPSIDAGESLEKMKAKYTESALGVPYLADKEQVVMESLGARKSPEAFLLKNSNGKFTVVYVGAIDDNPQVANDVKQNYLKDAIEKLLAGQTADPGTMRAAGCTIRRK